MESIVLRRQGFPLRVELRTVKGNVKGSKAAFIDGIAAQAGVRRRHSRQIQPSIRIALVDTGITAIAGRIRKGVFFIKGPADHCCPLAHRNRCVRCIPAVSRTVSNALPGKVSDAFVKRRCLRHIRKAVRGGKGGNGQQRADDQRQKDGSKSFFVFHSSAPHIRIGKAPRIGRFP